MSKLRELCHEDKTWILKSAYDELKKYSEHQAIDQKSLQELVMKKDAKLRAIEINRSLRTYDGVVPELEARIEDLEEQIKTVVKVNLKLEARIEKLRAALEYYSNYKNYGLDGSIENDTAKEALEEDDKA